MSRHFSSELVEKVRLASDIVETISEYIPLKKAGTNYKGLCPFHQEKTPSFTVSPEKQIFHCFGCGVGGDAISFIMKLDNVSFPEAVQYLGERYHIPIEGADGEIKKEDFIKESIYCINKSVLTYFQQTLGSASRGKKGLEYLEKRGFDQEIIKTFSLGYATPSWDGLLKFLDKEGKRDKDLLVRAGIVKKNEKKLSYYDVFRDRVIFPIFDAQRRVAGFGGRAIGNSVREIPKYLNTSETPVYSKGKILFGLHLTKDYIRSEGSVIIVEGYSDIITLFQHGIKNTVATSGTALTEGQVHLLRRYTEEAIIVFDGDAAGLKAAEKGFHNLFSKGGVRVKVVILHEGSDPDSFVRQNGRNQFLDKVKHAKPYIEYMIDKVASTAKNGASMEQQALSVNKVLSLLADIPDIVLRTSYVSMISERLGISHHAQWKQIEHAVLEGKKTLVPTLSAPVSVKRKNLVEYLLIQLMLLHEEKIKEVKDCIDVDDFEDTDLTEVVSIMFNDSSDDFSVSGIVHYFQEHDRRIADLISKIVMEKVEFDDVDKTMKDCIKKIRNRKLRIHMDSLMKRRKEVAAQGLAGKDEYNKLQEEYNCLRAEMT